MSPENFNPFAFTDVPLPGSAAALSRMANFQLAADLLDYLDDSPISLQSLRSFVTSPEWRLLEQAMRDRIVAYESVCLSPNAVQQYGSLEQAACAVASAAQTRSALLDFVELPAKLVADLEAKEALPSVEAGEGGEYDSITNEEIPNA